MLTIDMAVLLTFVVVVRLRRRTEARSRFDERLTVFIVLLLAPTDLGHGILRTTSQLAEQLSHVAL